MSDVIIRNSSSQFKKSRSCSLAAILAVCLLSLPATSLATFEKPPVLDASAILDAKIVKGKNHTVNSKVINNGIFNHYTVSSPFGEFKANTTTDLKILVNEINAIAAMKKVETDDTAVAALKTSGEKTVAGLKNLFNDPEGTMEGAASGVSSLFNRARETVGEREVTDAEDSTFEQVVGITRSKGEIASKYGVNIYSRNLVLQEELDRLARADYIGGLGVGVATSFVPGVGGLVLSTSGTARLLNDAINTTPASELWLQNKNKLLAMKFDADTVKLFINNPVFTPTQMTIMVNALEEMKGASNRDLFLKISLQASDYHMARTITALAVMAAGYHRHVTPIKSFSPMGRIAYAVDSKGRVVVLLPADYVTWNEVVAKGIATFDDKENGNESFTIWNLGSFSERAQKELAALGWKLHSKVRKQLIPNK